MANTIVNSENNIVFTALFGNYEDLNELKIVKNSGTRYVCFTDNMNLKSKTWEIFYLNLPYSPQKQSRYIKMLGHRYFPKNSKCLYIDNSVELRQDGSVILESWLKDSILTMLKHSKRKTVKDEFFVCAAYGLEEQDKLLNQLRHYKEKYPEVLREKPFWGGMSARIYCEEVDHFMEIWFEEFLSYSKRDQLSLNIAKARSGIKIKIVPGTNSETLWHKWPVINNRDIRTRATTSDVAFRKFKIIKNVIKFGFNYYIAG